MMKHCNPRHPSSPPSLGIGGIPMDASFPKIFWNFPRTVPTLEVCHFNLAEGICYTHQVYHFILLGYSVAVGRGRGQFLIGHECCVDSRFSQTKDSFRL